MLYLKYEIDLTLGSNIKFKNKNLGSHDIKIYIPSL